MKKIVRMGERSARNAAWIEKYLRVPEGRLVGQPLKLTGEQKQWLVDVYDSPTRLFILSMGRKNAKTTFCAMLLLLHLAGPEAKKNSQLFSAAQSKEQAAVLFQLAAKMVRMSPQLKVYVNVRDTVKHLLCPELGTIYKALSAEASTAYGLNGAVVIHDELGQVRGPRSELYEALETSGGAAEEPISFVISTQAPTDADLLSTLIDDALLQRDPRTKIRLYSADPELPPFSEEAIRAANPHYDVFMNKEEVLRQASDAQALTAREPAYRNLVLNQRVEARSPLFSRGIWDACSAPPLGELGPKRKVWAGLDLSSVSDLTAFVDLSPFGGGWDVRPTFWLPEEGLAEKARLDKVPWDSWQKKGLLQTTPGKTVEYEYVASFLRGLFDRCDVQAVAFDRYNMRFLTPWLRNEGFTEKELEKFQEFGQGYVSMSPAIRVLESLVKTAKLRHGGHPILAMCNHNAVVASDPAENRKFVKGNKATGRIDGMVALAMAAGVTPTSVEAGPTPRIRWA